MISFSAMVNAWSLLHDEITFNNEYTVTLSESKPNYRYNEDAVLQAAQEYISSTYRQHYTSDKSPTQTLDLIESIGDAEPFCRSNAIKYLSRYDKKGSAKRDILKAIHYCVLLYNFVDQSTETETYETF